MTDFVDDELARRIRRLESRVDTDRVVHAALASHQMVRARSRRRLRLTAIATPLVLLLAAVPSAYYAPVFAQALADAPIAGGVTSWMLRGVGLAGVPHRVMSFGDVATSGGYSVQLVGGYADSGRTILFARVSPPARVDPGIGRGSQLTVTDQFGATYRFTGGLADSATGENTLIFEPLRWPASQLGARLRLGFNTIVAGLPPGATTTGRWTLSGTIAVDEGQDVALPSDGTIGPMQVTFTKVRGTGSAVLVEMRIVTGGLDLQRIIPDAAKGHQAFAVRLLDGSGSERPALQASFGSSGGDTRGTWMWFIERSGRYELQVAYEGIGAIVRTIDVP